MRFSLSSRASVASRASPSPGLAHGVKTSVVLSSEARRCLLRALSGFCSAVGSRDKAQTTGTVSVIPGRLATM